MIYYNVSLIDSTFDVPWKVRVVNFTPGVLHDWIWNKNKPFPGYIISNLTSDFNDPRGGRLLCLSQSIDAITELFITCFQILDRRILIKPNEKSPLI